MREEYFVFIILELCLKAESEVEATSLLLHPILEVANILTVSLPSNP